MGGSTDLPALNGVDAGPPTLGAVLHVDLDALVANFRSLQQRLPRARCAAVVKANAYGLGATQVASALYGAGCTDFFVAHLQEGETLRSTLDDRARIYVLNGVPAGAEQRCLEAELIAVLNSLEQLDAWRRLARSRGQSLIAALQIDTGMSRLGMGACDVARLIAEPEWLSGVCLQLVMSHLACADEPHREVNEQQLHRFLELSADLPSAPLSLANSSGVFLGESFHFDLVRPGAALYGINPQPGLPNPMKPVVSLTAPIVQVRKVSARTAVGYAGTFVTSVPSRIATVALGYADGWPRSLSDGGHAYLGDVAVPIIGRISMDTLCLDVSGVPEEQASCGSKVEFLGTQSSVDAVAEAAGTIAYEILARLGGRVQRRYGSGRGSNPN